MTIRSMSTFLCALSILLPSNALGARKLPGGWRATGGALPWEKMVASPTDPDFGANSCNGNSLLSVPLVAWTARGGQPCGLVLWHNSQGAGTGPFGEKWRCNLDIELYPEPGTGDRILVQGDGLGIRFLRNIDGSFSPPTGMDLSLSRTGNGWTLGARERMRATFMPFPDGVSRCVSIADRNDNRIRIERDATGNPLAAIDPTGRALRLQYAGGKVVALQDPLGHQWSLSYDSRGDLVRLEKPWVDGVRPTRSWTYDARHNPILATDECGGLWRRTWDEADRVTSEMDPVGGLVRHSYGDGLRTIVDALGATRTLHYDARGRIVREVDPLGFATSHRWNDLDRLAATTDPQGRTTRFQHDGRGRCIGWTLPDGRSIGIPRDAAGEPAGIVMPSGRRWSILRDARGNRIGDTDPLGSSNTLLLDPYGTPIGRLGPAGGTEVVRNDGHGNPAQWTGPCGETESATWDLLGRPVVSVDAAGLETVVRYDTGGRIASIGRPGGRTWNYRWDAAARLIAWTDPSGAEHRLRRDLAGRIVATVDPSGAETRFRLDPGGRCIEVVDPVGRSTAHAWNLRGERIAVRFPDGSVESFAWTPTGQPERRTDARGISAWFQYDVSDRPVGIRYSDATPPVDWAWDLDDRPSSMRDGSGTTRWVWDNADRAIARESAAGTVVWTWDAEGRALSTRHPRLGLVTHRRDASGRLLCSAFSDGRGVGYAYDRAGRRIRTEFPDGTAVVVEHDPNNGDQIATRWVGAGGAVLDTITTRYDAMGRRTAESRSNGEGSEWAYDSSGRLSLEVRLAGGRVIRERFLRDASGVIVGRERDGTLDRIELDVEGRPVRSSAREYQWDAAGNAVRVVDRLDGATRELAWDAESRLQAVSGPGGFRWLRNGDGVPVARIDGGGTHWLPKAGDGIAAPSLVNGSGDAILADDGVPVLRVRDGIASGIGLDALGSVRWIGGERRDTTAHGAALPGIEGGFGQGWGYELDQGTDLVRTGHRIYDPEGATYLSRDPALEGTTPYSYCDGDPVNAVDPDGLEVLIFLPKGPDVPTRGGGRTRGRLILIGDDGRWIREWPANSGGSRAPGTSVPPGYPTRLPKGTYDLGNPRRRETKGMVRDDVGFSIDLEPRFPTSRRYLRIHPDGGGPGTQGCIGVLAPGKDLESFYRIVRSLIRADRLHLVAQ